jgi:ubiquinone/menaquinone biosynthesis C-methylase UbiE
MPAATGDGFDDWERVARGWERGRSLLWNATRQVSEWLIGRLDPRPGQVILELAAGTGETGFLAAPGLAPGGRLISSDRSPAMVAAARRLAAELGVSNVEFRTLDSAAIDLEADSIDGAISRFGYILRGDPPPALTEVRRVLRPGGRLAFAVWGERERNSWMTVPADVMIRRGHLVAPSDEERRLSERRTATRIGALLDETGFGSVVIEEMPVSYAFADASELWLFVSELRGPLSVVLGELEPWERERIRREIEERAVRSDSHGYERSGVSLNVVSA